MTICIAAITENKHILAIADKMVTLNSGVVSTYEINESQKIIEIDQTTVALFAGHVLNANEILQLALAKITPADSTLKIAEKIQQAYIEKFQKDVQDELLAKFGLDLQMFTAQQRTLDQNFVSSVINTIDQYNLGVEIIVAGIDSESPQLYRIYGVGQIENHNPIGYVCIGSGSSHANLSMVESHYHPTATFSQSMYSLIKAKRKAEFDPGVGELSSIVSINGKVEFFNDDLVKKLWKEYEGSVTKIDTIVMDISKKMEGLVNGISAKQSSK